MKIPYTLLVAFLPLVHSKGNKNAQSLPKVDLGYQIHQAIYYDVSDFLPMPSPVLNSISR